MTLSPHYSITQAVVATPYPPAPSIWIAYPGLFDWVQLYDKKTRVITRPSFSISFALKLLRDANQSHDKEQVDRINRQISLQYMNMKSDHEKQVWDQLDAIKWWLTGQAVFAELSARPSYSVMIFPFDFLPTDEWRADTIAATLPVRLPTTALDRLRHDFIPFDMTPLPPLYPEMAARLKGTQVCEKGRGGIACFAATGTGSSVDIFFTPGNHKGPGSADQDLLHELVHASRIIRGLWDPRSVSGGYKEQEEFLAITVENIYGSEKGRPPRDHQQRPIDAASFLDTNMNPTPRQLLALLQTQQPSLFAALAGIQTQLFNPVQQVDAEMRHRRP